MNPSPLRLNTELMLAQLRALGEIGRDIGPATAAAAGRTRIALTDADRAGRDQLLAWMQELGLDIHIDRIGNLYGLMPAATPAGNARPLMMGSHIDTVAHAGALDGCYGVLAGLAVLRAFKDAGVRPSRALAVAVFTNEEGVRYQPDMMGSLVAAGGLSTEEALDTVGTDGSRLGDELARIGYAGALEPGAIVPQAFIELHIEQGPVLEAEGLSIGVVEGVQGISWQRITLQGVANHAGTTPTRLRHDAGYAAAAAVAFLREQVAAVPPHTTLATVGSLRLEPDLVNVIARRATFTVDLRDPDEQRLQAAEQRLAAFLADLAQREGVQVHTESLVRFAPVAFDPTWVQRVEDAAQRHGWPARRLCSGAGHDAQMMARVAPAAMIFVPSQGGISHNPREHTDDAHLAQGAQLLLTVVQDGLAALANDNGD